MKKTADHIRSYALRRRLLSGCNPVLFLHRNHPDTGHTGRAPVFTIMIIFLICIGAFVYYSRTTVRPVERSTTPAPSQGIKPDEELKQEMRDELEAELRAEMQKKAEAQDVRSDMKPLIAGWITITDPWGRQVTKFRGAASKSGWIALPARACVAGKKWEFTPDSARKSSIMSGLWVYGDRVGLWRLEESGDAEKGMGLGSWNEKDPVSWQSLESEREYPYVMPKAGSVDGFFISSALPDSISEIGIFTQNEAIVGWSFGDWLDKGYMWKGESGPLLKERTWVSSFYNVTFANGREEKFAMALSMPKTRSGMNQLVALVDGFRLEPKLTIENTPSYLLPEEVIRQIRHILANIPPQGNESRITSLLNSRMLKRIGDIHLVMDVVSFIKSGYGYEAATREMEDSGFSIIQKEGQSVTEFNTLHTELYQEWLQSLVQSVSVARGLQVFDSAAAYYPDDPYIHLFGVELELLNNNWEEAERLLYMRTYPPELQDRFELLALRITEMKGEAEEITVRFPGGSRRIIVTAVINGTTYQEFMVDTGASMVTIPSSAVEELGLEFVEGYHGGKRPVSTAGGVVMAEEVMIESIEINGWVEYEVRALVLDMPDQPGLGLLGLNYLGRFQVDLKPEEGTLKLTPQ